MSREPCRHATLLPMQNFTEIRQSPTELCIRHLQNEVGHRHRVLNLHLHTVFHRNRLIFIARQHTDIDIGLANLSVGLSVTFRHQIKTA